MLAGLTDCFQGSPVYLSDQFTGFSPLEKGSGGKVNAWAGRFASGMESGAVELLREAAGWAAAAAGEDPFPDISDARHASGIARHSLCFMLRRLLEALRRVSETGPEVSSGHSGSSGKASSAATELMSAVAECFRALATPRLAQYFHARAGAERAHALGSSHHSVAESMTGLADSMCFMRMFDKAFPFREEALAIRTKAFGVGHPRSLASLHELAGAHAQAGDFGRARDLFRRAVSGRRKALGPGHPDTAESVISLALCHMKLRKIGLAREVMESGFSDARQALGPGHPAVIRAAAMQATLLFQQCDYDGAMEMRSALLNERWERLQPLGRLTSLASAMSEPPGEDEFRALVGGETAALARLLGDSPQAAFTELFRAAALAVETAEFKRAGKTIAELVALRPAKGGLRFSADPEAACALGAAMCGMGAALLAVNAYKKAANAYSEALGMAHPDTVSSALGLASACVIGCELSEADRFAEHAWQTLKKRRKPQWADPEREMEALEKIAAIRLASGELAGHVAALERLVTLAVRAYGRGHPRSLRHATALSVLHALNGDAAKAERYRKLSLAGARNRRGGGRKP
jgi:tetratricopeptide (TPR) repeat protein